MNDHLLVEALAARDPGAAAAVYDAYADRLYAYCWFQLRCRDAAQVALRDTFIVAEAHVDKLRDPDRFGPWLYAVARLECGRRMPGPRKAPDLPVASHDQDDVDQRMMAWQAVLGLDAAGRELLELRVRHQLSVPDLAAVRDLPVKDAQAALDQAHADLEVSLTAEILAHRGPYGCEGRGRLLRQRRGDLDRELRGRLMEHAQECDGCAALRPRTVSAAKVFGLLPQADLPAELRVRVMSAFLDPDLIGYRLFVATRVADLAPNGFPVQPRRPARPGATADAGRVPRLKRRRTGRTGRAARAARSGRDRRPVADLPEDARGRRSAGWLAVGAVATALLISSGTALLQLRASQHGRPQSASNGVFPGGGPSEAPQESPTLPAIGGDGSLPVSATFPLGSLVSSAPPTALPSPPPSGGGDGGTEAPRPGADGTLSVSPLFLDLADASEGTVELRADGGPVEWRVKPWGSVRAGTESGYLQAGQTLRLPVRVSRTARSKGEGGLAFSPGDVQVRVTWRPAPEPSPDPMPSSPTPTPTPTPTRPPSEPSTPPPTTPGPAPSDPPPGSPDPESPPASAPDPSAPDPSGTA
ncbi:RNA polymerase sigma factor [Actinomadura sp. 9N407]|uniref:RNA polymerase sigma factor n=1 Tax=Actinomadura sp. 9N407 TaxID=3375154 RepID=UPI00378E3EE7